MNNFILHTPTKVLFGKGQVAQLRGQIPSDARILVTYGGGSWCAAGGRGGQGALKRAL